MRRIGFTIINVRSTISWAHCSAERSIMQRFLSIGFGKTNRVVDHTPICQLLYPDHVLLSKCNEAGNRR